MRNPFPDHYEKGKQDALDATPDSTEQTLAAAHDLFNIAWEAQTNVKPGTAMRAYYEGYCAELGDWLLLHKYTA